MTDPAVAQTCHFKCEYQLSWRQQPTQRYSMEKWTIRAEKPVVFPHVSFSAGQGVVKSCEVFAFEDSSWIAADSGKPQAEPIKRLSPWMFSDLHISNTWLLFLEPWRWLADNQVGGSAGEKSKHHPRLCHSVPLFGCTVHFWLRSDTRSPRRFSSSAMTMTVAMVMLCMMMVHANVKPQKDFSLQKVGWRVFDF